MCIYEFLECIPKFQVKRNRKRESIKIRQIFLWVGLSFSCVEARELYVSSSGSGAGGTSWETAYTNIQLAINNAVAGDVIWVTNGTYAPISTGNKAITIQSINGAEYTIIDGKNSSRCATLGSATNHFSTVLVGFTLRNGRAHYSGSSSGYGYGGGAYGGTLNNCVLTGNTASGSGSSNGNGYGGGAYGSTLNYCILSNNTASGSSSSYGSSFGRDYGGGASDSTLNNCTLTENTAKGTGTGLSNASYGNGTGYGYGYGGGVNNCTLNDCVLIENKADGNGTSTSAGYGGGAYGGTLDNCVLTGNTASGSNTNSSGSGRGGGAHGGILNNCMLTGNTAGRVGSGSGKGGGTYTSTLNNCTLMENTAIGTSGYTRGGGSYGGTLNNCILVNNSAAFDGGGAYSGFLNNCTLFGNTAGRVGGGSYYGTFNNCIIWSNTVNGVVSNHYLCTFSYSCTTPLPSGSGNISNDPLFVDTANGDYRLQIGSPCINTGSNALAVGEIDLDGNPRIQSGTVDMGAYEFVADTATTPVPVPHYWLDEYSLVTNNDYEAAALDDSIKDAPVWHDYLTGTCPTNTLDRFLIYFTNGVQQIGWTPDLTASGRVYTVEGRITLTNDWKKHDATNTTHRFFGVKVSLPEE